MGSLSCINALQTLEVGEVIRVPGVTEQYTTILWKPAFLLISLRDFLNLRAAYKAPYGLWKNTACMGEIPQNTWEKQQCSSPVVVDEDLRFPPRF